MNHEIRRTAAKLRRRLDLISANRARTSAPVDVFEFQELSGPDIDPMSWLETADPDGWQAIPWGTTWGRPRTGVVLRSRFTVPAGWRDDERGEVRLRLPIGRAGDFSHPEALVHIDGRPLAACDRHHQELRLPSEYCDGAPHELILHGWTGGVPEVMGPRRPKAPLVMGPCTVELVDQAVAGFESLARVALGVADELDVDDPARAGLYDALDAAFVTLDTREPLGDRFFESAGPAEKQLRAAIESSGPALPVDVFAIGHAHIDVAWLWTVAQTRRKAGRTFHNALTLMDEFPGFHFTQSQPQLYDYVRRDYPDLFAAIGEQVAAGRWEAIGGMWVEADCNLTGSEALARQFVLGRRFFAEHFGADAESPVLWLPDVFGYAWNLPQLIKAAGLDYFFTIKISWSQYNRLPYDSFWWQGLDGTRVLTHFSPTPNDSHPAWATYNAEARPVDVLDTWRHYRQREVRSSDGTAGPMLMSYGHGDGGGGPTREMIENLTALQNFPSMPRTRMSTVNAFFEELEKVADRLPVWNGELYLEYHRGTYTSQAATKWGNRRGEFALHNAEFLASWARLLTGADYPADLLTEAWKLLCLNQFHDIIPGSSIGEVYTDTAADHRRIADLASETVNEAVVALAEVLPGAAEVAVVNPNPVPVTNLVFVADGDACGEPLIDLRTGTGVRQQAVDGGRLLALDPIAAYGLRALGRSTAGDGPGETSMDPSRVVVTATDGGFELVNSLVRVVLDGDGQLIELVDLELDRSVLPDGHVANVLQAFEDRPLDFDAWDIEIYFEDREWAPEPAHAAAVVEHGPLRAAVRFERRLGASTIAQTVALRYNSRRVDFITDVDWHERHTLLKTAFPVAVHADHATFDIQWGNVARPVHRNTSWNWAQFETCAHKWIDLSEGDFGVSLLNDGKYGHDVRDNVLRLTLLRSPGAPDPKADEGWHRFTYSLLPHDGDWRSPVAGSGPSPTVAEAYALNNPPFAVAVTERINSPQRGPEPTALPGPLITCDRPNVLVETVKWAEDGEALIVRLYENERRRGRVRATLGVPFERVEEVDLLERSVQAASIEPAADGFEFTIDPYQIKTFRITF